MAPLTILIAADRTAVLTADEVAANVARGALRAAPWAETLRGLPDDAVIRRADLVLASGTSRLTRMIVDRAVELGVAAIVLGGSLRSGGRDRHTSGLVSYEPDAHPGAIDTAAEVTRLRQGAQAAVGLALAA